MDKKEKCSKSQLGRKVIHKGDTEKRVYEYDIERFLKEGWELGVSNKHKKNNSSSNKGKSAWNKGTKVSSKQKDKISKSLKLYYENNNVWNKGLTKDTDERVFNYTNHTAETNIKKYGKAFPNNNMSDEHKQKISKKLKGNSNACSYKKDPEALRIKLSKDYLTRKKNNSFTKSKPEQELYEKLLRENTNKTIYRQYKDNERYPFYCDFYIVEDDLFIELNAHWTHGGKPFDENDAFCIKQLELWKEKAKTSKFFKNAIETWTVRDVKKLKVAKENKLNYKVIY